MPSAEDAEHIISILQLRIKELDKECWERLQLLEKAVKERDGYKQALEQVARSTGGVWRDIARVALGSRL